MPSFLAETYLARPGKARLRSAQRARGAAKKLAEHGTRIRFVRSIYVPNDEICFLVFDAISADAVEDACARAGIRFERVVEAVESPLPTSRTVPTFRHNSPVGERRRR
ncbi:MAG: hypothetical protein AUH33_06265 [Chloroflexi bacterium 13_1_40CM_68_21]|nr:MAG: hypothetical protein AUH33_06265 [Chloroflexi bacterium 13_1_40CM_68_21]